MSTLRRQLGDRGEDLAVRFLCDKHYTILARNYATRFGELDIVAKFKGRIVVVEVKTRKSFGFGLPEEAINYRKAQHLLHMTKWYMLKEKRREEVVQIDCIAIDFAHTPPQIRHIENIIQE